MPDLSLSISVMSAQLLQTAARAAHATLQHILAAESLITEAHHSWSSCSAGDLHLWGRINSFWLCFSGDVTTRHLLNSATVGWHFSQVTDEGAVMAVF